MKVFISGPMTDLPDQNYPAFNALARRLRQLGHEVHNPAENKPPADGSHAGYMRLSLRQLTFCEGIVLLPGWAESQGALMERAAGQAMGIPVVNFVDVQVLELVPLLSAMDAVCRPVEDTDWSAA